MIILNYKEYSDHFYNNNSLDHFNYNILIIAHFTLTYLLYKLHAYNFIGL